MKSCNIIKNYLEYCEFDKELDKNTLKAYRIDLRQYYEFTGEEITSKETIESISAYCIKNINPEQPSVKSHQ